MTQTQAPIAPMPPKARPKNANAALVLTDGTVFWGKGVGVEGVAIGEVCFNTSITGYQEIMTDPSYAGQIITFTFPHIGNTGTNAEDIETAKPAARAVNPSRTCAATHTRSCRPRQGVLVIKATTSGAAEKGTVEEAEAWC